MIDGRIEGLDSLDEILADLRQMRNVDLRPLGATIARIVEEDTRAGVLAGTAGDGGGLAQLKASTLKHRDGSGPPGAPTSASSIVRGLRAAVTIDADGLSIESGWAGQAGQHARFLVEGNRNQAPREIRGLRPGTIAKIQAALDDFARAVVAGS